MWPPRASSRAPPHSMASRLVVFPFLASFLFVSRRRQFSRFIDQTSAHDIAFSIPAVSSLFIFLALLRVHRDSLTTFPLFFFSAPCSRFPFFSFQFVSYFHYSTLLYIYFTQIETQSDQICKPLV